MIEFDDGTTSDIQPFGDAFEQFLDEVDSGGDESRSDDAAPVALHVGSEENLRERRAEIQNDPGGDAPSGERLDRLERKIGDLEEKVNDAVAGALSPRGSFRVAVPSPEEVVRFSDHTIIMATNQCAHGPRHADRRPGSSDRRSSPAS